MKLELEKFKLIPSTYNAIDFMKIQYEDKDLVMKLKGEFFITDVRNYGLRLVFTPDDYSIIDKIYELGGFQNKSELNSIFLSMNKNNSIFQSQKHSNGSKQMQIKTRRPKKKSRCVDASPSVFHHFQLFTTDSTHMQNRSKSMNSSKKKRLNLLFDEED